MEDTVSLIDGIRAALYTNFLKIILKGGFAGTAQFINFGMHHLSLSLYVRQESGEYQPEPIWALAFLGISRVLRYVFGLAHHAR